MENQLTPITVERLKAAGFEADGSDTLTRVYKLYTKWQTVTIFHQYRGNGSFTLKGIRNIADRYTTAYAERLIQCADLFGADEDTLQKLCIGLLDYKW